MTEVFPALFGDWYIHLTPVLRWICFGIDLFAIICIFSIMKVHNRIVSPVFQLFLLCVLIHTGSRAFAIMQGAELFISPFTLMGSIGVAGGSCMCALGITGMGHEGAKIAHVKMRQEFILDHKDSAEIID